MVLVCRPVALWHDCIRGLPKGPTVTGKSNSKVLRALESAPSSELRNPWTATTMWRRFHALEQV
jgi:hypothetical protein